MSENHQAPERASVVQPPTAETWTIEEIRSRAEQLVEKWYYEVSTPRFENDSELAELQSRIASALTTAQQQGAELQPNKAINLLTVLEHQVHRNHEYHPAHCGECAMTEQITTKLREQLGLTIRAAKQQ